MATFANAESGSSVRTKINEAINKVDGAAPISSINIDGGTIDGVVIGGSTPGAITGTTGQFDSITATSITATSGDIGLSSLDLTAIAETKAVTAVDVFVYDTSKDSDGGAWRKRTQGTSWYNETLNTATRGSRREFPAVAVIVAEAAKVTIYDGDDPALPMWMVVNSGVGNPIGGASVSCVFAGAGRVIWGDTNLGVSWAEFPSDTIYRHRAGAAAYNGSWLGGIETRNDAVAVVGWTGTAVPSSEYIVNNTVNDVAMTVLPDAPIDPATGLQVPTIAVATAGGVSVITDSGAVYDSSKTTAATDATVDGERLRIAFSDSDVLAYDLAPIATDGFTGDIYDPATTPALLGTITSLAEAASGSTLGMTLLIEDKATPAAGMIARVTSSYNSGYQNGDIKGAFLSDTSATALVGSGELWNTPTISDPAVWSWDGSTLTATGDGTSDTATGDAVVAGKVYVVSFTVGSAGAGLFQVRLGSTFLATLAGGVNQTYSYTVVASGPTGLQFTDTGSTTAVISNISVKLADADRSVNNKGLIVNGTVTRTAVATGADLVAYSGFSASNYLEQPYNSDLDFGTGDFCVMGWVKTSGTGWIATRFDSSNYGLGLFGTATSLSFKIGASASANDLLATVASGVWLFVSISRSSGILSMSVNGSVVSSVANTETVNGAGDADLNVGAFGGVSSFAGSLALWRISATAPAAEQVRKIYEDEKFLFQEGAQATLYGASNAVTALAHDPVTDLLHVGTSAGRSVFSGLRRVSNTTTAVGTAISASNGLIAEE